MTIILTVFAAILLIGMIADKDEYTRDNLTIAFIATLAVILLLSVLR